MRENICFSSGRPCPPLRAPISGRCRSLKPNMGHQAPDRPPARRTSGVGANDRSVGPVRRPDYPPLRRGSFPSLRDRNSPRCPWVFGFAALSQAPAALRCGGRPVPDTLWGVALSPWGTGPAHLANAVGSRVDCVARRRGSRRHFPAPFCRRLWCAASGGTNFIPHFTNVFVRPEPYSDRRPRYGMLRRP